MPKISIITVSYNAAETIGDCLESVASQTERVEHILIDGGSTDNTLLIAEGAPYTLSAIVSEPDNGVYDAMNKGIRIASGDIIGILNADDIYYDKESVARVAEAFESSDADVCYADLVYVEQHDIGRVTRYWKSGSFAPEKFYSGWMPPHPTFFVRRTLYERYGLFRLDLGSAADYELMLRLLVKHRATAAYIPELLVRMRAGGVSNTSLNNRLAANRMDRRAWEVNGLRPYPWTLLMKPVRKLGQWFMRPPCR